MDLPSKTKQRRASLASKLWDAYVLQSRERHQQDRANRLRIWGQQGGQKGTCKRWRDYQIEKHMALVTEEARKLSRKFPRVPLNDLIGAGYLGLINAADRLDPARQGKFKQYARFRIRGAIHDAHKRQAYFEEHQDSIDKWTEGEHGIPRGNGKKGHWLRDRRPLPDEEAIRSDRYRQVQMLISELRPDMAQVIRETMAGATVDEIARLMRRSPAWVRARLVAARNQIGAGIILL